MTRNQSQMTAHTAPTSSCSLQLKCFVMHFKMLYLRWWFRKKQMEEFLNSKYKSTKMTMSPVLMWPLGPNQHGTVVIYSNYRSPNGLLFELCAFWMNVQEENLREGKQSDTSSLWNLWRKKKKRKAKGWCIFSLGRCTDDAVVLHLNSACSWRKPDDTAAL